MGGYGMPYGGYGSMPYGAYGAPYMGYGASPYGYGGYGQQVSYPYGGYGTTPVSGTSGNYMCYNPQTGQQQVVTAASIASYTSCTPI
jgi:hypothetical protein